MSNNRKLSLSELNRPSIEEFKKRKKLPLVVVLDNIRSLNNIGSIFRTCDALGIGSIHLCGITGHPPHREIHKTALGAENSVVWTHFEKTTDSLISLREDGFKIFSIEQTTNSISINDFMPNAEWKYAFVFGNEVKGVEQDAIDFSDGSIEIPQLGTKHSFNVAITNAIVLWDYCMKTFK